MKWGIKKRDENSKRSLSSFHREMDRVFDDFFSLKPGTLFESEWIPKIDVEETEKAFLVSAELPGMEEKDINVTLEKNILTISGEKKEEKEEKDEKKNRYYTERHYGSFRRSVTLPEEIRTDNIKANFKKGVLTIDIPKDEKAPGKKISIEVK